MSEIQNLIAEIEKSIMYDDKPKTWNFDSISYVARLIRCAEDLREAYDSLKLEDTQKGLM